MSLCFVFDLIITFFLNTWNVQDTVHVLRYMFIMDAESEIKWDTIWLHAQFLSEFSLGRKICHMGEYFMVKVSIFYHYHCILYYIYNYPWMREGATCLVPVRLVWNVRLADIILWAGLLYRLL